MEKNVNLLALSGTKQANAAAQLAWAIERSTNGTVTAQHVIDTYTVCLYSATCAWSDRQRSIR